MSDKVVVVAGARTPFVKAGADLKDVAAAELGRAVASEVLMASGVDPTAIDEVIFGCVAQPADSANVARVIALRSGVPQTVPAVTVGRNCGSGMEAVTTAMDRIAAGRADLVLAGGVESMSRIPLQYPLSFGFKLASWMRARSFRDKFAAASTLRLRDFKPEIALEKGLTDPVCGEIMGLTAERLAREYRISREEQDAYALESHQRAVAARDRLSEEIHPLGVPPRFFDFLRQDIGPRDNQSLESLGKMKPYFDRQLGTVTIGNSCSITDGAAALLLARESRARELGLPIIGILRSHAYRGLEPERMGLGPVHATPPALESAGVQFGDLDRIEINEAFAAQVLACLAAFESDDFGRSLGLRGRIGHVDRSRLNVNGGAIALGHPVGATGARLILSLCHQLEGGGLGLATLCIGGGQGGAVVVEGVAA